MLPNLCWYAPTWHYPYSNFTQHIAPETDWFFVNVLPGKGDAKTEQKVVREVASYGRQLGVLTEVVLELTRQHDSEDLRELDGFKKLKRFHERIEDVKAERQNERREQVRRMLEEIKEQDDEGFEGLVHQFRD